jgi:hypothetical protein
MRVQSLAIDPSELRNSFVRTLSKRPRSTMSAARSTVHELGGLWGVLAFSLFLLGVPAQLG